MTQMKMRHRRPVAGVVPRARPGQRSGRSAASFAGHPASCSRRRRRSQPRQVPSTARFSHTSHANASNCAWLPRVLMSFFALRRLPLPREPLLDHTARRAARRRSRPRRHRGRDEALVSRLRDERDRRPRPARRARRAEAGAPAHHLRDARERLHARQAVPQGGAHRRRRDGQIPPARRSVDLRRAGAHGAGLRDAAAADRGAGQLRLDGRRPGGGDALHRGAAGALGPRADRRHRQGHRRFPAELRRQRAGTGGAAGALPQRSGQRRRRHRRRHGDEHPAAQPRRGDRRLLRADRRPRSLGRRDHREIRARPGFPDRRDHSRPARSARRLPDRPRVRRHAGAHAHRGHPQGPDSDHRRRGALPGEQGADGRDHRRSGARQADRGHRRPARRERPRRHPRGDRDQARRRPRDRAQPALPLHAAADVLRHLDAGARRPPAADDEPEGGADGVPRLPRGGDPPTQHPPARQGARAGARAGRPRHRRRQHRRGGGGDPKVARSGRGARGADRPRLADR